MSYNVIEIRNYLIRSGATEHFQDYFEANFIHTLRDVGVDVLGQFRCPDLPDHFVWMRGFGDMESRRDGLERFYGGPVWKVHRTTTNGMIRDAGDVHLLRPLDASVDLTCGWTAAKIEAGMNDSSISTHPGMVVVDIYQAQPCQRDTLIDHFLSDIAPGYQQKGMQIRGYYVAEMSENTYPRLHAFQNADEFVVITAYDSEKTCRKQHPRLPKVADALLNGTPETLYLSPTLRSPLRYLP